ncbi:DEAD/DEAH box helicase family protein [Streptomyces lasalocidi]
MMGGMPVLGSVPSRDPVRPALHPHQTEGLERAVKHLGRAGSRGLYVSATGTGKTLVAVRIADALEARLVWSSCRRWTWRRRPRWRGAGTGTASTW